MPSPRPASTRFVECIIELRVVREKEGGTGCGGFCGYVFLRIEIGLEILDARVRRVVHKLKAVPPEYATLTSLPRSKTVKV